MIEINLLPIEHRPIDRTPAPRLAALIIGVFTACLLLIFIGYLMYVRKPQLRTQQQQLRARERELQDAARRLAEIQKKIREYQARQSTVCQLIAERVRWTRILDSLADKRTEDPNAWLSELKYGALQVGFFGTAGVEKGDTIQLTGYAVDLDSEASDPTKMSENAWDFSKRLRDYSRFADMFVPGGIKFISAKYVPELQSAATSTARGAKKEEEVKGRPGKAVEFRIDAELYPPGKRPAEPAAGTAAGAGAAPASPESPAPAPAEGRGESPAPAPAEGGGEGPAPAPAPAPSEDTGEGAEPTPASGPTD